MAVMKRESQNENLNSTQSLNQTSGGILNHLKNTKTNKNINKKGSMLLDSILNSGNNFLSSNGRIPSDNEIHSALSITEDNLSSQQESTPLYGMKQYSASICQNMTRLKTSTYSAITSILEQGFDCEYREKKNIKRRAYDTLNVLLAAKIISKEDDKITWIGLKKTPELLQNAYATERTDIENRLRLKKKKIKSLMSRLICFHNIIKKNQKKIYIPRASLAYEYLEKSDVEEDKAKRIQLPFILLSTAKKTRIECEILDDRTQYFFDFDSPFKIHEEIDILTRLNFDKVEDKEELKKALPQISWKYIDLDENEIWP